MSCKTALDEYAAQQLKPRGRGCVIATDKNLYLSGRPYIWTAYADRAFVFRDDEDAQGFINEHPPLSKCHVIDRNDEDSTS
jgi:hypothetical protein